MRFFVWGMLLLGFSCGSNGTGLLAGRSPSNVNGVFKVEVLNDGVAVPNNDNWNTSRSARFDCNGGSVDFELGGDRSVDALWLQGDNNDTYSVLLSNDGQAWVQVWTAPVVPTPGMQPRFADKLGARGRFLRVQAAGGDGSCALSEVIAFEQTPSEFPPNVPRKVGAAPLENVRTAMLFLALALVLMVVLSGFAHPRVRILGVLLLCGAAVNLINAFAAGWFLLTDREVSMARGVVGAMTGAILWWEAFGPRAVAPKRNFVNAALLLCGLAGVFSFYNFARGQFRDDKLGRTVFVHYLDLRQYFQTAKYFPEISYYGMFTADLAAYLEDTGVPLESLDKQIIRDLDTNKAVPAPQLRAGIESAKAKFSPERWETYKKDARYFREAMSTQGWLNTMFDLGGNATPLWIATAYLLFNIMETSYDTFVILAFVDPLLLLAFFITIGRVFGLRTAALVMALFGANDFVMFGTNWAGSVLRHDWLVYLGLGAAALRKEKWILGGVFLALSTSIRAFPAFTLIAVTLPALWWVAESWWLTRRLPRPKELFAAQKPTVLVAAGAAATFVAVVVVTSILLGPKAWTDWAYKVSLINSEIHANPVCLKTVFAGNDEARWRLLDSRALIYWLAVVFYLGSVAIVARKKRLEQAAMLGLIGLPVLMMPANYYLHVVCLFPLIANFRPAAENEPPHDAPDTWSVILLLGVCALQYYATRITDLGMHFYWSAMLLMIALAAMLIGWVRRDGQAVLDAWKTPRAPVP